MNPLDLLLRPLGTVLAEPLQVQFPGLRGTARFDGPGGTLVHAAVRDVVAAYLGSEHVANDHGPFAASRFSDTVVDWATGRVKELLGAREAQVCFGPNMTTMTSMFVRTLAERIGPGDEIVCTELDHEANIAPWTALARSRGASVHMARLDPSGLLPAQAVIDQITERTAWVAITAASNALGTVPDVSAVVAAAHAVGARVYVDGVQAVPHLAIDFAALGCDALVTSPYKWYGPHAGVLVLSEELAQDSRLSEQVPSAGEELPGRLELGTTNFEAVLGTGVAAQVLLDWDREDLFARERSLTELLITRLTEVPGVRVLGPGARPDRVPVVTFQISGLPASAVAQRLDQAGVSVWDGSFYASYALAAVVPEAPEAIRAGIAAYTTETDVHTLADAVAIIAKGT